MELTEDTRCSVPKRGSCRSCINTEICLTSMHRKHCNQRRQHVTYISGSYISKHVLLVYSLCICLMLHMSCHTVSGQTENQNLRQFPSLFNAAQNKPILTEPSQSTCGVQERSAYCKSSIFSMSVDFCNQDFCVQQCPGRSEQPTYVSLLTQLTGFSDCVFLDTINTRPGSSFQSASTSFISSGPTCFVTPSVTPDLSATLEFTITVWVWQKFGNNGTLFQKVSKETGEIIFELNVRDKYLNFVYKSTLGLMTVTFPEIIPPETWTYVAVQVYASSLSFFLNGVGVGFTAGHTVTLVSPVQEAGESWVRVGLSMSGTYQFLGRLQDFRFFPVTLSNREIAFDYSEHFPELRVHSSCRCPASHPRVKPQQVHYCIKNGVPDNTNADVLRLNVEAHPLEYVNDADANSIWISDFMDQTNLLVDLGDEFQVFYVLLHFYSPFPMAVEIERKTGQDSSWLLWQQFASDCLFYFNTIDNGPLPTPSSVNCLKISDEPALYSRGNITFNILNPEPVPRPGSNYFFKTPELFDFVSASQVRVKLQDHFFITNERHRYYGLYDYKVVARCECYGHASVCDHASLPYTCQCLPESYTQGRQCNECQPLYNNKPFRRGDQYLAFDCVPCECHGHADSCVYNETLDSFPEEHDSGGGGVCVDCQHNTEGQFCQDCVFGFYRPDGKSLYVEDVCSPCDCYSPGIADTESFCKQVGGQCQCKVNVESRRCDTCQTGFYNLTGTNPDGCQSCDCVSSGTVAGDNSCSTDTGQCNCKLYVRGTKCEYCQYGFFNLDSDNANGCQPCNCNPFGSTNQYCEPETGQCLCKNNIAGRQCDQCADGYWAFESGCIPCNCNLVGTKPPGRCNKTTGQCDCKDNVVGLKCDLCKDETYGFGEAGDLGCIDCTCNPAGTINGSMLCDKGNGNCVCKSNVQGVSCNTCKGNTWGLSMDYEEGCIPCDCDDSGTQFGDRLVSSDLSCNQNDGQCTCLVNRIGRQCDDCQTGYFISMVPGGGCLPCDCDSRGTLLLTYCDTKTGQCECKGGDSGVTGITCEECLEGYFKYNFRLGSCSPCGCDTAGSLNDTCDPFDGQCLCKEFATSRRCSKCVGGSSFLDPDNPYGCSKAPDQQPPPEHDPVNSTAILLTWKQPDYPNGVIQQYRLFRNDTLIHTLLGDERTIVDHGLQPFTVYSYVVEATNAFGSVFSAPISFRTPSGPPYGVIILNATSIKAKSARFSWNPPQIMNGMLRKYVLYSTTEHDQERISQWEGQELSVLLVSLIPFTNYIFYVDCCTDGGCLSSEPALFSTMSAVPEGMYAPVVLAINNTALHIAWKPPEHPNGIIIFYELWMRGSLQSDGSRIPPEMRIFHPSGQFNPRPTGSPQENALPPPETEYVLTGLIPFTVYEFQVLAENSAGKAASAWVSGRTGATNPAYTPPPIIISRSPFSLNVTWIAPSDLDSRGVIIEYRVYYYMKTDLTANPFAPPYMWKLMFETGPDRMFYILSGLSPYSDHSLMVEACNSVGCVNSTESIGRTQQDIPEGLTKPLVDGLNASAMGIQWTEPSFPNGPAPYYRLQKTTPALSYPPQVISGTRFPGGGYYLFPPDTIPPNVAFTGIRFWFRTRKRAGLLLFAASEGQQSEFVALQFKAGRPWFLFDPQGCASFVTPTNDEGLPYNDNTWHQMVAWRDENVAYISIDGVWTGTRTSNCAKGTIIGPNTGVYIGGLPHDFEVRRNSRDSRLRLIDHTFQGCIRDIQILQQIHPVEVWTSLSWDNAIHNELAFLNWEGCPINLDKGIHFMGQGFARFGPDEFQVGDTKNIDFGFRTQMHTGIIFFAHGGTGIYIFCALVNGALHFEFSNGILVSSVTFTRADVNFCDSRWYNVKLEKKGQRATMEIVNIGTEQSGDPNIQMTIFVSSDMYVGGMKLGTEEHQFIITNRLSIPVAAFAGCIRNLLFDLFFALEFLEKSEEVVNVNMDGCTPFHQFTESCIDDLITEVYNGTQFDFIDTGLQPYTDYLYRVLAINDAGAGTSPWGYGRTKEGFPAGVTAPYEVTHYNGTLVGVKWLAPVSTSGLLTKFVLRAYYKNENITLPPVEAMFTNTSKRIGNMTDLIPYTRYGVTMLACTSGGCSESPDELLIHTVEEAPLDVQAPVGIAGANYIYVSWGPPGAPNGVITGYFLYMDDVLIYTGGQRYFNVSIDLQVYTSYVFYLRACTKIGCTEGPQSSLNTAQLPPTFLKPPTLVALGVSEVEATWETPDQLNGVLERYVLFMSQEAGELGTAVYNSTAFFLNFIISDLLAGSQYFVTLQACTGGGCTRSNTSEVTTPESAPGGVQPPTVTSPSPSQLHVEWKLPLYPNGVIMRYDLFHNEMPVYSGLKMYYDATKLLPYSLHAFRLVACTKRGCGSSSMVKARTQESSPEGFVTMEMKVVDPRTVSVLWTVPESPNGNMFFDVYFEGLFYKDIETWDYTTYHDRLSLHRSREHDIFIDISPVIPMSTYTIQVNASNTVGHILSNTMTADMPPGSPDGVRPPDIISQTPTTVTATWLPVGRENSVNKALFKLEFRRKSPISLVEQIFGPTTSFTFTKENLLPYTEYEFRLVAENAYGPTRSAWVTIVTREDRPAGFAVPSVVGIGPRYMDIVWQSPITPNGAITEFKIYQNGEYKMSTAGNVTHLRLDGLRPYEYYHFLLEVCTSGGCTRSPQTTAERTFEDVPEEVVAPKAESKTPASIELTWQPPVKPNGELSLYTLERRVSGTFEVVTVVSVAADAELKYIDEDMMLTPFTQYEYRLIVTNGAGEGMSGWTPIATMSSRPGGLKAPNISIVGPDVMNVSWEAPLQPNGVIEFYTVRLPEPRVDVHNVSGPLYVLFEDLVPYTELSVTVTACTSGGCTQSPPVAVRTHATVPEDQLPPVAEPVSQSMISIVWQGPLRPNGPNIRFELSRILIRQPLDASVNTTGAQWTSIYAGTGTFFEDRGLPMYTTYHYRVTVYNDIGQLTSDPTPEVTTYGGFPRQAAQVTATAVSHTQIGIAWVTPNEIKLQGSVKRFNIHLYSSLRNYTRELGPGNTSTTFSNLTPNTQFYTTVTITIHGDGHITSEPVYVTTLDGAPEGIDTPTLSVVSETALRVSWMAPVTPNGEIIGYNVIKNGEKIETGLKLPGSYVLTDLRPFIVYTIQLEVCTVFDCVTSDEVQGSTVEALPQALASPRLMPLSPYQISIMWQAPLQPNGVILRYDLWKRVIQQCSEIPKVTLSPEVTKCTYIQCGILENLCGTTCYSGSKVCCDGVLYDSQPDYQCCGRMYALVSASSDVCCGGTFHAFKTDYTCCNNRYEHVAPGDVCCYDNIEDRVTVGKGNQCCGTIPYSSNGAQICCAGRLYEGYGKQCCGGEIVSMNMVCCCDEVEGEAYSPLSYMSCCGLDYVWTNMTLCCTSDTGHVKVHHYISGDEKISSNQRCCGMEAISNGLACCNYQGYNPSTHVCADVSHQQSGCGSGTVCLRNQKAGAFCDQCDFDTHTYMCGSITGYYSTTPTPAPPRPADNCVVSQEKIYSGPATDHLNDGNQPFSLYEFAVSAMNSAGSTFSNYTRIQTLQAQPEILDPPVATLDPKQLYMIFLAWKLPQKPNGEILRFILVRDGIELYRGLDQKYTDDTTILPYRSYTYILSACTVAGCISSNSITVATAQAAPEGVQAPKLTIVNASSLNIAWSPPYVPNGIITQYQVHFEGDGLRKTYNTSNLVLTVTGLTPFSRYNATLTVCTEMACTNSTSTSILMPEAAPVGMSAPEVVVRSSTSADVYWKKPTISNGMITFYALIRSESTNQLRVFLGEDFHATDYNLVPGHTYMYFVTVGTAAGNTSSNATAVTMPDNTPLDIEAPTNVTVLNSTSIYVTWAAMSPESGVIDQYRVLVRPSTIALGVGLSTAVQVNGLLPYTEYDVRIQACLQGIPNGCGTGPGVVVMTFEAAPTGMAPPVTIAIAPDMIEIMWKPPEHLNGILQQYLIYYRKAGSTVELLINRVEPGNLYIRHAGSELLPYTEYEHKVVAGNRQGDVSSNWTRVRTLAAPPENLPQPFVTVAGAFSVDIKWVPPAKQNGVISVYHIVYKQTITDPTVQNNTELITVDGSIIQTSVSGMIPYMEYQLKIVAFNSAGNISSPWTTFKTGESSPSGLGLFDIERISTGMAVILRWGSPVQSNGVIIMYRIYESGSSIAVFQGLNREFELRRLEPFKEYSVQLEACTMAGCTRSFSQTFYTAETFPSGQPAPVIGEVGHKSVVITWGPPLESNGKIMLYEVLRRTNTRIQKRAISDPVAVYRTTDTDGDTFSYTDTNLQPFTEYQYSIRASNSKGTTMGPWQVVFTSQAPPEGVQPPIVNYISDENDALVVTWSTPDRPNGIIQSYQLQRNTSVPWSFTALDSKSFTDTGLKAFTFYSYTITACSGGGCTKSLPTVYQTRETAPLTVPAPTIIMVNSTALRLTWQKPQITTGVISAYQLRMDGIVVYEGMSQEYLATKLVPFTDYTFTLTACTTGGCTNSGDVTGKPDDAIPENMLPSILRVMSSRSIEITWQEPQFPNGIIISYDVRRNDRLIYTDSISVSGSLRLTYTDYNLDPGTEYTYTVTARNRKGSIESPPSLARTFASSPSGLEPPSVTPLSSTSIQVTWMAPINPNGLIVNYTLYREGDVVYSGGVSQMSYIVPGLNVWTEYTFRVQACTERGCTLSTGTAGRTLSSLPEEQGPPSVLSLADQTGAHSGVLIEWDPPFKPNGLIVSYEIHRREVIHLPEGISYGPVKIVYNGSAHTFTDQSSDLRPFTKYEFSVTVVNQVGKASSLWSAVTTKEAPPDSVAPPTVLSTTPTSITVQLTPPIRPNGVVRYYNVLVNGTVASSSVDLEQTLGQSVALQPFNVYALTVQACTAGGCTTSPPIMAKTGTAKPTGQEPVRMLSINNTAVKLAWSHPTNPNGEILRFLLYQRSSCPPTSQPFPQTCTPSEPQKVYEGMYIEKVVSGLSPYTAYEFQVRSENAAGSVDFPVWLQVVTLSDAPRYVRFPRLQKNDSFAVVDWTSSFVLNSKLQLYKIVRDGVTVYTGITSHYALQRYTASETILFRIEAVTETGEVKSPDIVFDPTAVDNIGTTAAPVGPTESQTGAELQFYREVWFIALMVVIGVLLLLLLLGCCIRHCCRSRAYIRERLPLQSRPQKRPFTFMVDSSDGSLVAMESPPPNQDASGYYSGSVNGGVINPAYLSSQVSQPSHKKKQISIDRDSLFDDDIVQENDDDFLWDKHDSGLVSQYDSESIDAPSYSIKKEQTVFTDTHL